MEDKNQTIIFSQRSSIIAGTGAAICGALGIIVNIMAIIMVLKQPKVRFFCEIERLTGLRLRVLSQAETIITTMLTFVRTWHFQETSNFSLKITL